MSQKGLRRRPRVCHGDVGAFSFNHNSIAAGRLRGHRTNRTPFSPIPCVCVERRICSGQSPLYVTRPSCHTNLTAQFYLLEDEIRPRFPGTSTPYVKRVSKSIEDSSPWTTHRVSLEISAVSMGLAADGETVSVSTYPNLHEIVRLRASSHTCIEPSHPEDLLRRPRGWW